MYRMIEAHPDQGDLHNVVDGQKQIGIFDYKGTLLQLIGCKLLSGILYTHQIETNWQNCLIAITTYLLAVQWEIPIITKLC